MSDGNPTAHHYAHPALVGAIRDAIHKLGKTINLVTLEDLAPVDEFHIGGRAATAAFLDQLEITADTLTLDVGCGLGGASRFAAHRYGCRVHGIDLTPAYIEAGRELCSWVGLGERICLEVGDVTDLSHPDGAFDRAYMMHVGMNIPDKRTLAAEVFRVLRPAGMFGIYDVMRVGEGELEFPVPWAQTPEGSAVATPQEYKDVLQAAGFHVVSERNRNDFALEFFAELETRAGSADGRPPLGLHILMGDTAPAKVRNMIRNISRGIIAPVELIARKPAGSMSEG